MENMKVDKDSFYNLVKKIFDDYSDEVSIQKIVDKKKRYMHVENDFYKCVVEHCFIVDKSGNPLFISSKPVSGFKIYGNYVTGLPKNFDASVLSLEDIKDMTDREVAAYPFVRKIPNLIESINAFNESDSNILSISDEEVSSYSKHYKDLVGDIKKGCRVRK